MNSEPAWTDIFDFDRSERDDMEELPFSLTPLTQWRRTELDDGAILLRQPAENSILESRLTLSGSPDRIEAYILGASAGITAEVRDGAMPGPSPTLCFASFLRDSIRPAASETWRDALAQAGLKVENVLSSVELEGDASSFQSMLDNLLDAYVTDDDDGAESDRSQPEAALNIHLTVTSGAESIVGRLAAVHFAVDPYVFTTDVYSKNAWGPASFKVTRLEGRVEVSVSPGVGSKTPNNTASVLSTNDNNTSSSVSGRVSNISAQGRSKYSVQSKGWTLIENG